MNIKKLTLDSPDYPAPLHDLQHGQPEELYVLGDLAPLLKRPRVAIVGSRKISPYGKDVTHKFATALAEQGIVIISGLAFGVDAAAHRAALDAEGLCIAVLPSPLDNILPRSHRRLAQAILDQGGALVSEYPPGTEINRSFFIARNRIMSGLAQAVLVTEAGEHSGAWHTAKFAVQQSRDIYAVPGNINSQFSVGTNNLIKADMAGIVTSPDGLLLDLGLTKHRTKHRLVVGRNATEQKLLDLLLQGVSDGDQLLEASGLDVSTYFQTLTLLEIANKIRPLGLNHWAIV